MNGMDAEEDRSDNANEWFLNQPLNEKENQNGIQ
jgi:hypothetical protein